jgi:hypothetical protein
VKRSASVPKDAVREFLARRFLDAGLQVVLHQPVRALLEQRVEIDAVNEVERIQNVAFRLRHLVALVIAHESVDVDFAERYIADELEPHHQHAGDPEEDDVEARD